MIHEFKGSVAQGSFGRSVDTAGDVNMDGTPDFLVGAPGGQGAAHVFSGLDGAALHSFTGNSNGFGLSVRGVGDVNKDGAADLLIGAYLADGTGQEAGQATLFSGKTGLSIYKLNGDAADNYFGYSVSAVGDIDMDGFADLFVGAYRNDGIAQNQGLARLYSGRPIASYTTFGSGCSNSPNPPELSSSGTPKLGQFVTLEITNITSPTIGGLIFGDSNTSWNNVPLPLNLAVIDMPNCDLLVSEVITLPFSVGGGNSANLIFFVPNDNNLLGVTFYNQAWVRDPSANAAGIAATNGAKGVIGLLGD